MATKESRDEDLIRQWLNLVLPAFPSGFYFKDLRWRDLQNANWPEWIPQEDALVLRIHTSQLSEVLGTLIEHGQGPGIPAAVLFGSPFSELQPVFGKVSELPTKLKGLPEQDLLILIHEGAERIKSFLPESNP